MIIKTLFNTHLRYLHILGYVGIWGGNVGHHGGLHISWRFGGASNIITLTVHNEGLVLWGSKSHKAGLVCTL